MSKYEYAYYDSERRLIAVADIREESKKTLISTCSVMKGIFSVQNASKPGSLLCRGRLPVFPRSSEVCSHGRL